MKRRLLLLLTAVAVFALASCGGEEESAPAPEQEIQQEELSEPVDLAGMWKMTNGNQDAAASMEAKIADGNIEIVWVIDGEASGWDEWLYWSGSYIAPTEPGDSYTWISEADGKAASALLGSSDETKDFRYENGVLRFDVTFEGETITAEMERNTDVEDNVTSAADEEANSMPEEGAVGDFYVSLKDCAVVQDYEGNDALLVNYSFTNNSEETTSALIGVYLKAFQDGVQLEIATVMGRDYDEQKEIRPGVTMETCQAAFLLNSNSPVEVEVSDIWTEPTVGKIYEINKS